MNDLSALAPIPGYDGYYASRAGDIYSTRTGRLRPHRARLDHHGYYQVILRADNKRHGILVHKAVLLAYVGPKPTPKHVARHLNGNAQDNRIENLTWGTQSENIADAIGHGTVPQIGKFGEEAHGAKLTEEQVLDIEQRARAGEFCTTLAREYDITPKHVCNIRDHKNWRHLWAAA